MAPKPKAMDKTLQQELDTFREKVAAEAEQVIFEVFPQKILDLQKLIDTTAQSTSPFNLSQAAHFTDVTVYSAPTSSHEPEAKKRKLDSGEGVNGVAASSDITHAKNPGKMVSNKHTVDLHEQLKREFEILANLCDKVKLWINLSMPKIEDGNNFGVQIQEDVLSEIHRSQETAYNLRDSARQDYITRAKLCSKILKYPHLEDYALALKEHDEKVLYVSHQNLFDLRNVYAVLTDILHKNIEKLRTPKANNSTTLY
ncbi:proteasome activator pa28 REG alpha/beta subunit [Trametes coccinea BRFM310]|uniref:Proteasome activator pa28 REG alpha/beta subunit n=1 Tax=Trametes coccinea (strain BRFM310) TaxID=1353009 RepID=A0A1Y2IYP9_TRAC3|nr:proteasome activator pa28 REG alpha/beta subunit [Trametes coccinea BRFM310]